MKIEQAEIEVELKGREEIGACAKGEDEVGDELYDGCNESVYVN